jgi:hypothetical protein
MPQALIPALISLAIAGTETGMSLAGVGQPSQGAMQSQLQAQQTADAQKAALAQKQQQETAQQNAIVASTPDAIAESSGSLTNPGNLSFAEVLSNNYANPGVLDRVLAQFLGTSGEGSNQAAFSPSTQQAAATFSGGSI